MIGVAAWQAILRALGGIPHIPHTHQTARVASSAANSRLYDDILRQHIGFLGTNLLCSAAQAGKQVAITVKKGDPAPILKGPLNCGNGPVARFPYYIFALAMIGTTYYQQRQMTKATPQGGNQQQQMLTKFMPLLFGVWGFIFPAGLVLYWTTTNLIQIGQQHFMLPRMQAGSAGAD